MAASYCKMGNMRAAVLNVNKSLKYAGLLNSKYLMCRLTDTKAEIYLTQGRLAEAEKAALAAKKIAGELNIEAVDEKIEKTFKMIRDKREEMKKKDNLNNKK